MNYERRIEDACGANDHSGKGGPMSPREIIARALHKLADGGDPDRMTYQTVAGEPHLQEPFGPSWTAYEPDAEGALLALQEAGLVIVPSNAVRFAVAQLGDAGISHSLIRELDAACPDQTEGESNA